MSYENPWLYNGEVFDSEQIEDNYGFIYLIECEENSRKYLLIIQF
jgi:hypothetical protein